MAKRRKVGNLLALGLLSLLSVSEPMYPYEMAQTLRARSKDQSIRINWGSLYTVVQNLEKYGYIESVATEREGRQPERTTYRITDSGRAELKDWMRELMSVPDEAPTRFESALGEWMVLSPDEAAQLLTQRLETLDKTIAAIREGLGVWTRRLPRLLLIEAEYKLAMRVAEADWVRGLIGEIASGTIPGVDQWRRFTETGEIPQEMRDLDDQARRGWPEPDITREQSEPRERRAQHGQRE
ncbi:MAG: PadR family transcriptional regulator [Nocardiopsaceae bacterium]|nr:PadR family transcriptional regulator [Nocardiopsaceae bacterium]